MDAVSVATKFVDLALKYPEWSKVKELPEVEARVLFETIVAAGFEPERVVPGKLKGECLDEDGRNSGETYLINGLCPYKVVSREDGDHQRATFWLDHLLRSIVYKDRYPFRGDESREQLIEAVRLEIEQSIPLESIQLTSDGDLLCEYPSGDTSRHTRDDHKIGISIGLHKYCNGWLERRRATATHDVIVCRACHLRVLFLKEVKTYGELRQALTAKLITAESV